MVTLNFASWNRIHKWLAARCDTNRRLTIPERTGNQPQKRDPRRARLPGMASCKVNMAARSSGLDGSNTVCLAASEVGDVAGW